MAKTPSMMQDLMDKARDWTNVGMGKSKKKQPKSKPASSNYGKGYDDPTEETTEKNLKDIKKRNKAKLGKLAAKNVASYTRQGSDEGDFALGTGAYSPARKVRKGKY